MPDFLPSQHYQLGRGINLDDAPEHISESEALELINFRFEGRGRWTTRRAASLVVDGLVDPCGVYGMPHGELASGDPAAVVYLDYDQNQVKLYKGSGRRDSAELVGTLAGWNSSDERPITRAAVLAGCLWIVDEQRQLGMTCYDPLDIFGQGELFQPKFKFNRELDTPPSPIYARDIQSYNNFLFVCGHGTEDDPDQPEIVRFSYLGMAGPDAEAAGDASLDVTQENPDFDPTLNNGVPVPGNQPFLFVEGGVEGLFDIDDYFPVGQRGIPVMGMQQGAERLVICTRLKPYILFGYDRSSFELDLLDSERGLVATRAIGEADGKVYWMSPLGPCRWEGGAVIPMQHRIRPLLRRIAYQNMFFHHQQIEYEARWYYSVDGGDPDRSINYSYLFDEWRKDKLGVRVSCGGHSIPGTILRPGPGGQPIPPPPGSLVQPFNLHCEDPTDSSILFVWSPQETGPDIVTEIQWRKVGDPNFGPTEELDASVDRKLLEGLETDTEYEFRVRHVSTSTGEESLWVTATCRTLFALTLIAPRFVSHKPANYRQGFDFNHEINFFVWQNWARWIPSELDAVVDIEYRNIEDGTLVERTASALDPAKSGEGEDWFLWADSAISQTYHAGEIAYFGPYADFDAFLRGWRVRLRHRLEGPTGTQISPWTDELPLVDADESFFEVTD